MTDKAYLGGHLRAQEGLRHVVVNTRALGYNAVQIMVGDDRGYEPRHFPEKDSQEFRKLMYGVELFVHLPYVINPCESVPQRVGWYKKTFKSFCRVASELGARGVVIHPGFKKELTEQEAYKNLLKFFETTYDEAWGLDILLETDTGSKNGSAIGAPSFISDAIGDLESGHYGMVIDTEHLYARGLDLWDYENLEILLEKYGREIKLVHLNSPDPDVELGSHRDRHNTPFQDRSWDHQHLFRMLLPSYPCILERSSLAVQEQDVNYIRSQVPELFPKEEG